MQGAYHPGPSPSWHSLFPQAPTASSVSFQGVPSLSRQQRCPSWGSARTGNGAKTMSLSNFPNVLLGSTGTALHLSGEVSGSGKSLTPEVTNLKKWPACRRDPPLGPSWLKIALPSGGGLTGNSFSSRRVRVQAACIWSGSGPGRGEVS